MLTTVFVADDHAIVRDGLVSLLTANGLEVVGTADKGRDAVDGVLRLAPTWVPRSFLTPGRRIKLNPKDIYAYGADRGGIDERWFASTTPAATPRASAWVVMTE